MARRSTCEGFRELHGGASHARNLGLRVATGSQIRFVDADDVLEAGSTARLQKLIGQNSDTIAYGTTLSCDEQLRGLSRRYELTLEGDVSKQFLLGEFDVSHLSMLFPRTVIERTGEWSLDFAVSADRDFVQRALEHGLVRGEQAIATFYRRNRRFDPGASRYRVGRGGRAESCRSLHRAPPA